MPAHRPLIWNYFAHVTPFHESYGAWSSPQGKHMITDWSDLSKWTELAKICERGRFDAIFFGDTIGIYDVFKGSPDTAIRTGVQFPTGDPSVLISALAAVTTDLGFAMTSSILQAHPFEFARRMSTLDMFTKGRVGWNIVTSYLDSAARNMGKDGLAEHDDRYAMADDYMETAYRLWERSWDDDALVRDTSRGMLYDPARIHPIDHVGEHYRSAGPFTMSPTPQRTPVLYQAGSSARGTRFAAEHAEVTFLGTQSHHGAADDVARVRAAAAAAGRRPEDIACVVMFAPIVGSTEDEARRRQVEYRDSLDPEGIMAFFGGAGVDLSSIDLDSSLGSLAEDTSLPPTAKYYVGMLASALGDPTIKIRDAVPAFAPAGRFAGTPEQIADEVERWRGAGVDGFNLVPPFTLGWAEEWVDQVVPVLQARGLVQSEYRPGTLREKLFHDSARPTHARSGEMALADS